MNKNRTTTFVFTLAIVAALFVSACDVLPERVAVPPAQAIQACSIGNPEAVIIDGRRYNCADVKNAMATLGAPVPATAPLSATAMPGATPGAPAACTGYAVIQTVQFGEGSDQTLLQNMDVGDSRLWSVVQAWNTVDVNSTFMALVEPGMNLDFEAERISGTYWFMTGTAQSVQCRTQEMWAEAGSSAYRLYVGDAYTAPNAWSTSFPTSWTMKTWAYEGPAIEVEGSTWQTITVLKTDATHTYGSEDAFAYGQLWNGQNASVVYHLAVRPGWTITTPKYQGTVWLISGVNSDEGKALLQERFDQMTGEVIARDDKPTVRMYYCGSDAPAGGWTTTLSAGWTCKEK